MLFFIPKSNIVRRVCKWLLKKKLFEWIILFTIVNSSIILIVESYLTDKQSKDYNLQLYNTIFTSIFITELFIKVVSLGVFNYLKDSWNILDLLVVIFSILEIVVSSSLSMTKVIRLGRVLRPLKFLSKHKSLKTIVTGILQSF